MNLLDLTLPSIAENLALDEALLDRADFDPQMSHEVLRIWENPEVAVVVGRASKLSDEVNLEQCERVGVPVLRRASGGAAVVVGPGCLMYSVILSLELRPQLHAVDRIHQFVLHTIAESLRRVGLSVELQGTSDLTCENRKISGNSLRCKRQAVLYHGTLLYDFPLETISQLLTMPPRQPDYRQQRPHAGFVANLPIGKSELKDALVQQWDCREAVTDWPEAETAELLRTRYSRNDWNRSR